MKKYVTTLICLILMALPVYTVDYSTSEEFVLSTEMEEVTSLVEEYLTEAAYAIYLHSPENLESYTIESILDTSYDEIKSLTDSYSSFLSIQKEIPYENTTLVNGKISDFLDTLELQASRIAYYECVQEIYNIGYVYFTPSYIVTECCITDDHALVIIYESLNFQYDDCNNPSYMGTTYDISLIKIEGRWYISSVEAHDEFFDMYRETGFDLKVQVQGLYEAQQLNEEEDVFVKEELPLDSVNTYASSNNSRTYIGQNAANYALTYTTDANNGQKIPTFKNENFYWNDESCQLFASQCVWAGFGGSNDTTSIANRQAMDKTGNYTWWSDTKDNNTKSESWATTSLFKSYVDYVKGSSTETGVVCDTYMVSYNSDNMGSSVFSNSDLLGAVLHGHSLGHAVVVTEVNGLTRDKIYQSSYNYCRKNIKLSVSNPSSTTNTGAGIYIMVPRYLREPSTAATNYIYADLLNALVLSNGSVTANLSAHTISSVSLLKIRIYKPGSTSATNAYTATNTTSISQSYTFTQAGLWKIVVSGTNLDDFTYTVRVVSG